MGSPGLKLLTWLLGGLVASVLALKGGVHPRHSSVFVAAVCTLGIVSGLKHGAPLSPDRKTRGLGLLFLMGLGLQLLPLPPSVRSALSPGTQRIYEEVLPQSVSSTEVDSYWQQAILHSIAAELEPSIAQTQFTENTPSGVGFRTLSLAPFDGLWTLSVWLAALAFALLAYRIASRGHGRLLLTLIFVGSCLQGALGIALIPIETLGFFEKTHYLDSATGTLVNRNHFGTLMLLGLGAGAVLCLQRERRPPGPGLLAIQLGLGLCVAALLASESRAALSIFVAAVLVFVLMSRRVEAFGPKALFYGLLLACIFLFAWTGGLLDRFATDVADDRSLLGRREILGHAFEQWRGFLFAGCGIGAFSWMATVGHEAPYVFHFSHLHNDFLQALVEGGLLAGASVLVFVGATIRKGWRRIGVSPNQLQATALGLCLVGTLVHSLVDFPLRIPGVLFLFATLTGIFFGLNGERDGRRGSDDTKTPGSSWRPQWIAIMSAGVVLSLYSGIRDARIHSTLQFLQADEGAFRAEKAAAHLQTLRYGQREGAPRLALKIANAPARERGPTERIALLRRASDLALVRIAEQPLDANAHLVEARSWALITQAKRDHGMTQGPLSPEETTFRSEAALARALKLQTQNPLVHLEAARTLLLLAANKPLKTGFIVRASQHLRHAVGLDPWISAAAFDLARALPDEALVNVTTEHPIGLVEAARTWQQRGDYPRAEQLARSAISKTSARPDAHFVLAELLRRKGDLDGSTQQYRRFLRRGGANHAMNGWAHYRLGDSSAALKSFDAALRVDPRNAWAITGKETAKTHSQESGRLK